MEEGKELKIGTLLLDMGRIAIVTKVIKSGALETMSSLINWRLNYELVYSDGSVAVIGGESLYRMIAAGMIEIM